VLKNVIHTCGLILGFIGFIGAQTPSSPHQSGRFVENKGQVRDENYNSLPAVLYYSDAPNFNFYLRETGVSYQLTKKEPAKSNWSPYKPLEIAEEQTQAKIRVDLNFLNTSSE